MLEEIIEDKIQAISASNQPVFDASTKYEELKLKRDEVVKKWQGLDADTRKQYRDQRDYEAQNKAPDLKDEALIPAKNYSLLAREAEARFSGPDELRPLPLDGIDLDSSVLELAESLENVDEIRSLYRLRKRTVGTSENAGINKEEATRLKNCFSQGRELYLAGRNGSLMVKPLNFFYALTAYSYGIIILNNPLRFNKGNLPGSHGMGYLPDSVQAQFGGDSARGTFSDLVTAFPTHLVRNGTFETSILLIESVLEFYNIRHTVGLGTLLSMIPEMSEYYKLTTGKESRCFPLEVANTSDPRGVKWEFHIGNGENRPGLEAIQKAFPALICVERHGKSVIAVSAAELTKLRACIYTDIRGKFWFVDNPFYPVVLPEVAIHFLANSVFSNIMRYRPDEWGNVLSNDVKSNISLVTRHYFSSYERKFFILILRCLSRYLPYVV